MDYFFSPLLLFAPWNLSFFLWATKEHNQFASISSVVCLCTCDSLFGSFSLVLNAFDREKASWLSRQMTKNTANLPIILEVFFKIIGALP